MQLTNRNLISGLEGCGKSSQIFQHFNEVTTSDSPILFGVKNYKLMQEQVNNWSQRFNIPIDQFAIAGLGRNYEAAIDAYTNKEEPGLIGPQVRFIFTSQANIQRNNHLRFFQGLARVKYSHIIIDEFDFVSGIIPSLDYELSHMQAGEVKKDTITQKLKWVERNYTYEDRLKLAIALRQHSRDFLLASWIEDCECPLTFLSSEKLVELLFRALDFNLVNLGTDEFKNHVVKLFSNPLINRNFFNLMNNRVIWNQLPYNYVISDCINSHFENNKESLRVSVISHLGVRGSNAFRGQNILTVLSFIPPQGIQMIKDYLSSLGLEIGFSEVESLFYRDRLCQAVGRVLGYRANTEEAETYVVAHSSIAASIQTGEFPYSIEEWNFDFDGKAALFAELTRKKLRGGITKEFAKSASDYSYLNEFFEKEEGSKLTITEIKNHLITNYVRPVPATKVAAYFGVKINNIKGSRLVFGLKTK